MGLPHTHTHTQNNKFSRVHLGRVKPCVKCWVPHLYMCVCCIGYLYASKTWYVNDLLSCPMVHVCALTKVNVTHTHVCTMYVSLGFFIWESVYPSSQVRLVQTFLHQVHSILFGVLLQHHPQALHERHLLQHTALLLWWTDTGTCCAVTRTHEQAPSQAEKNHWALWDGAMRYLSKVSTYMYIHVHVHVCVASFPCCSQSFYSSWQKLGDEASKHISIIVVNWLWGAYSGG